MEVAFGTFYPDDEIGNRQLPDNSGLMASEHILLMDSAAASSFSLRFRERIKAGETLYLLGFLGSAHNSGIALVSASEKAGIEVVANCEEERFVQSKHFSGYPAQGVRDISVIMRERSISLEEIVGIFYAFDVIREEQGALRSLLSNSRVVRNNHLQAYIQTVKPASDIAQQSERPAKKGLFSHSPAAAACVKRLRNELGLPEDTPCVQMPHHENHAYAALVDSPFRQDMSKENPVLVACIDGGGDLSSTSLFIADGAMRPLKRNVRANSIETFFLQCGILLGGWSALSTHGFPRSDNRMMAAAMNGNGDRLTNPFYKRLRQFFHFAPGGDVFVNTSMAANSMEGLLAVAGPLRDYEFGTPLRGGGAEDAPSSMRRRFDVAAAVQLVLEDAVFHVIDDALRVTGADRLILCGQVALNTIANMRLLERFGEAYYSHLDERKGRRLRLWVSPNSADQGAVAGAAIHFAALNGVWPSKAWSGPWRCGRKYNIAEIDAAISASPENGALDIRPVDSQALPDTMARLVSMDRSVAFFGGAAENGARALGHRSIFFNPRNPQANDIINTQLKKREAWRAVSPMLLLDEAQKWFYLEAGAAEWDYDAYRYMLISARARPGAAERFPAAVGPDGTGRIQILRKSDDAFLYSFLVALKARNGAAICLNTSFNIETPIVQTPEQAVQQFVSNRSIDVLCLLDGQWGGRVVFRRESSISQLMESLHVRVEIMN